MRIFLLQLQHFSSSLLFTKYILSTSFSVYSFIITSVIFLSIAVILFTLSLDIRCSIRLQKINIPSIFTWITTCKKYQKIRELRISYEMTISQLSSDSWANQYIDIQLYTSYHEVWHFLENHIDIQ